MTIALQVSRELAMSMSMATILATTTLVMISIEVLRRHVACHPAGEHWIWRAPVQPQSACCITRDAIMTHSKNPLHLHCRIHSLVIGSTLKWQLDTPCKSQPLVSQVGTAGADADTARVVFGSFNRLRAGGAEPCGIQRGTRMDINRIHGSHQQGGTHRS